MGASATQVMHERLAILWNAPFNECESLKPARRRHRPVEQAAHLTHQLVHIARLKLFARLKIQIAIPEQLVELCHIKEWHTRLVCRVNLFTWAVLPHDAEVSTAHVEVGRSSFGAQRLIEVWVGPARDPAAEYVSAGVEVNAFGEWGHRAIVYALMRCGLTILVEEERVSEFRFMQSKPDIQVRDDFVLCVYLCYESRRRDEHLWMCVVPRTPLHLFLSEFKTMKSIHYTFALSMLFGIVLTGCPDDDSEETTIDVAVDMAADEGSAQDAPADLTAVPDQDNVPDQTVTLDDMGQQVPDMGADLGGEVDMPVDLGTEDMSVVDMSGTYPPVTEDPLGGTRPATIVVPEGFDNTEEVPLVILLHGYTATGALQDSYFKLSGLVDDKDFILVYPDGTRDAQGNQFWNATDACCDGFRTGVDDVGYLRGMIEEAVERFNIDRGRIYLLGHSNGGFMSYRMACDVSEYVTAIFSLAGASYKDVTDCQPDNPVHVVQMHGTSDTTISYVGGNAYPGAPAYPSAAETVGAWAGYNNCTSDLLDLPLGDVADTSVLPMTVKGYEGCDMNGSIELWTIQNGSHLPTLPATFAETVLDHMFAFDRTP